ncbi:MAG: hypothetical protein RLZZ241_1809 [Bacteroidota bacterium]|jgi:hypothetical protein
MNVFRGFVLELVFLSIAQFSYAQFALQTAGLLPNELQESSGLVIYEDKIISHNDSGNEPMLYLLDTVNYKVSRTVRILGYQNVDWEDVTIDDEFLYISDSGNNNGNRTDLKILKLALSDIATKDAVFPQLISFSYEDQSDFSKTGKNDWDAEALAAWGDVLILFTKQRKTGGTVLYSIPKTPGNFKAQRMGEIKNIGLVTGATVAKGLPGIYLVGYSMILKPFLVFLPAKHNDLELSSYMFQEFLELPMAQTEAICAISNKQLLITSERFEKSILQLPASVFRLNIIRDSN